MCTRILAQFPLDEVAAALDVEQQREFDSDARIYEAKLLVLRAKVALGFAKVALPSVLLPCAPETLSATATPSSTDSDAIAIAAAAAATASTQAGAVGTETAAPATTPPEVRGAVAVGGESGEASADSLPAFKLSTDALLSAWLAPDLRSLRPGASALVRSFFDALDGGEKGHLSVAELDVLVSMQPRQHARLNAALGVVERRVGGSAANLDRVRSNLSRAPVIESGGRQNPTEAQVRRVYDAVVDHLELGLPTLDWAETFPLAPAIEALPFSPRVPRVDSEVSQLQREIVLKYADLHWHSFARARFPEPAAAHVTVATATPSSVLAPPNSGCTRDRFEAYVARELVLRPSHTVQWISAMAYVMFGLHPFPMVQLTEAHRQGRQGYGGKKLEGDDDQKEESD